MKRYLLNFLFLFFFVSMQSQELVRKSFEKMGSLFEISVVADNLEQGNQAILKGIAEIERIEKLISSWDKDSETSKINLMAGIRYVVVSDELFNLIKRSVLISELTNGAFDISYASADKVWEFRGQSIRMPDSVSVAESVANIGYKKVILDENKKSVFLPRKGMKIGFGAIGKGYAADKVRELLEREGISAGLVNASGDMTAWGTQNNGDPWSIGIINPLDKTKVFSWFPLQHQAVVTSGDYERFVLIDSVRYGHIINPKTGYPSKGILSTTVFAPKAEIADALSTAIFVMGHEVGLHLINQLPNIEALVITDKGKVLTSNNIKLDEDK